MIKPTHEQFIQSVRAIVMEMANDLTPEERNTLDHVKMVYGRGTHGLRGLTQYNAWKHDHCGHGSDLVEICALGEESWIQLAGTTIHELGHVLAGPGAGHSKAWKDACARLGLRRVHAAGTEYKLANFSPAIRLRLAAIRKPEDGAPRNLVELFALMGKQPPKQRVCSTGVGTRGGKSRGTGSGSRLRKYVCGHGQIIRASTDQLEAHCKHCDTPFELTDANGQTASQLKSLLSPATQALMSA